MRPLPAKSKMSVVRVGLGTDRIEDTASYSATVACVFVAAGKCLLNRCLATDVSSGSTIPTFLHHVTLLSP
jgi:hypothetical protein